MEPFALRTLQSLAQQWANTGETNMTGGSEVSAGKAAYREVVKNQLPFTKPINMQF